MGERRAITDLLAWIVALSTIAVVVTQDATAQETPPEDAAVQANNSGLAYYNKGDNDRAIDEYSVAILLDPEFALAYYNRGLAYHNKGDTDAPSPTTPKRSSSIRNP